MVFSTDIYKSWHKKQLEKYADLFPRVSKHLKKNYSVLDIGVGKAWLEDFLAKKGLKFKEIVGVDADERMTLPQKRSITYFITDDFMTTRKFDFVVCFDTLHLLKEPRRILGYSKNLVLVSLPVAFMPALDQFNDQNIIEQGEIGNEEKDHFVLIKV
jgi:2-polyprenyl-3-methyl-5-hydroxy-6-metoxy-1,4-benzoquinol methylase